MSLLFVDQGKVLMANGRRVKGKSNCPNSLNASTCITSNILLGKANPLNDHGINDVATNAHNRKKRGVFAEQ